MKSIHGILLISNHNYSHLSSQEWLRAQKTGQRSGVEFQNATASSQEHRDMQDLPAVTETLLHQSNVKPSLSQLQGGLVEQELVTTHIPISNPLAFLKSPWQAHCGSKTLISVHLILQLQNYVVKSHVVFGYRLASQEDVW